MDEKCAQTWSKLSAALKPHVSADTYKRWFSAVKLTNVTDDSFTFLVPNNIYQFWIESNHMAALHAATVAAFGEPRKIKFTAPSEDGATTIEAAPEAAQAREPDLDLPDKITGTLPNGLNPRNNFESFV